MQLIELLNEIDSEWVIKFVKKWIRGNQLTPQKANDIIRSRHYPKFDKKTRNELLNTILPIPEYVGLNFTLFDAQQQKEIVEKASITDAAYMINYIRDFPDLDAKASNHPQGAFIILTRNPQHKERAKLLETIAIDPFLAYRLQLALVYLTEGELKVLDM